MRTVGRGALAIVLAAVVVIGGVAAERIGPASPAAAVRGTAVSSVWLCPHGGGDGWKGMIALADPGPTPVDVRLTELGTGAPGAPVSLTVPAGHEVIRPVRADSTADATYVEVFGGWIAAGWLMSGSGSTSGLGAEPCAPGAAASLYTVDSDTERGQRSYLVVMNPFSVDAVFDVALFRPRLPPVRSADWTDLALAPGRSMALNIGAKVLGQAVVGTEIDVSRGRVGVASLSWSPDGGVRSVLASSGESSTWFLPVAQGAGQSTLQVFVPGTTGVQLSTDLLSAAAPIAAGTAADTQQPGASTSGYQIISTGASSVDVTSSGGVPIVAALRAAGQTGDGAATGGAATPGPAWLVPPTIVTLPAHPQVVVVNPGAAPVAVTLSLLTQGSGAAGPTTSFMVPAERAAGAPAGFLQQAPGAAILVTAGGDIVALGTSTSGGKRGLGSYASAIGVPIPLYGIGAG